MKAQTQNQLMLPAPRRASKNFASKRVTRRAWAFRKINAAANGVKPAFINWASCLKQAMGRSVRVTDAFGCPLGGKYSKINLFLLNEAPVVIDSERVSERTGVSKKDVIVQLEYLVKVGKAVRNYGFYSLLASKRPYPQPLVEA